VVRERGIPLDARETLFLRGGHDATVFQQRSGGVVVVGGDAEDATATLMARGDQIPVSRRSAPAKSATTRRCDELAVASSVIAPITSSQVVDGSAVRPVGDKI
jgi:hypothetical protein